EVSLAREAGLRYGAIALIVNPAAGLSPIPITTDEISRVLSETSSRVVQIIEGALPILARKVG
ncbi:MAG: 5'-methylthioadenosine phosphorylase, partial [Candidatus Nanopelagicaceae bacterium]